MWRKIEENLFAVFMWMAFLLVLFCLGVIMFTIIRRGLPVLDLDMIFRTPKGGFYLGREGGVFNAIVGSLTIGLFSSVFALLLSLPVCCLLNLYLDRNSFLVRFIRFGLDVLCGVPSIIYGALGLFIMVFLGIRASLMGGIIAVTLLVLPMMIRGIDEAVQGIPPGLKDASYALGVTPAEYSFTVLLHQIMPGLITAFMLSFGRGIGDAASVLFTAGFSDSIPLHLGRPAATLPLAIFFQLSSPIPEVRERAHAAALILTILVFTVSLTARILSSRLDRFRLK